MSRPLRAIALSASVLAAACSVTRDISLDVTDDLRRLPHAVQVRLGAPGTYIICLVGQQRGTSTGSVNARAELRRAITVR